MFLKDVAEALHTSCRVSEYPGVSNAFGAVLGDTVSYVTVSVRADYLISDWDEEGCTYVVYAEKKKAFETMPEAVSYASEEAKKRAVRKTLACGATSIYEVSVEVKEQRGDFHGGKMILGAEITACARGRFYL